METLAFNPENVTSRLEFFNYKYTVDDNAIRIMLPIFCYLEVTYRGRVTIRSRVRFALRALPIEANLVIYGLLLYVLAFFQWDSLPKGVFVLGGLLLIVFIVCLVNAASMRAIVHQWIEKDRSQ